MKTSDFDYELPPELIAQFPAVKRDGSRLLVYDRRTGAVEDRRFYELGEYLNSGDLLVLNNTKVIPARLQGRKIAGQGPGCDMEFLLVRRVSETDWETMARPGRRANEGDRFRFGEELTATVLARAPGGNRIVRFEFQGDFNAALAQLGEMPLPPYITQTQADKARYQTVYAKSDGSIAAPTAGLHFTPELLDSVKAKGVGVEEILLHVGIGTFRPVKAESVEDHKMHAEYYSVPSEVAARLNAARSGGRLIAVGTTVCRTLETLWNGREIASGSGYTDIFITPGHEFGAIDALITNFHTPKSTLLMLVSALIGREETLRVYRHAVEQKYRFYSFGDAMLIL